MPVNLELARRRFLYQSLTGLGSLALLEQLNRETAAAAALRLPMAPKAPHHSPKVKSCILLTMLGGVSQMDSFDPKPALQRLNNTIMPFSKDNVADQPGLYSKPRKILGSPWAFKKYGQCGRDVSDLFPHTATVVDDLAFVRSIQAENGNHPAAVFSLNTGWTMPGRASMGSWITYGLGSENQNLPGFVVLPDPDSLTFSGSQQWTNSFLPAAYQGTMMRWNGEPIFDLRQPAGVTTEDRTRQMELLRSFNQDHLNGNFANPDLQGRIDAYELAYRMQSEVPSALDLTSESDATREMYGMNLSETESFGTRCLMARRLVERGVRFVQLYTKSQAWDSHGDIRTNHAKVAKETDQPAAALIKDLKRRGLLDSTLVVWMGEFGRTPDAAQTDLSKAGRDHNIRAMTIWFAGGGIKAGVIAGETDDLGNKAVSGIYRMRDVHATILHLMGLNDLQLTYYHLGRNMRLTDTGGRKIESILS
ncbi:MAG: DUF1501 domain-containing protein [Bryobacterales bacterium]|nr:DUF1501 domain-containing protein [Bryobacterales bacterium]